MVQWNAEAIWEAVAPDLPGFTVEIFPEIDSTNTELMRRARTDRLEPVLLVAERQTAGRGRLGRNWFSDAAGLRRAGPAPAAPAPSGGSDTAVPSPWALPALTFSLGLPLAPADWSGLSLAVGVSAAESLHPAIGLKWPNDLWWQDRKLAGILIETALRGEQRYVVIGIGVNIAAREANGLSTPPVGLQEIDAGLTAPLALARIAAPLVRTVQAFASCGFPPFQARFNARDVLRDRTVALSDGARGTAHGVDERGALLVHTAAGMKTVTSSEISVRPSAPGA